MGERLFVNIEKQVGKFRLALNLRIGSEVLVLFGPSGAGKTQSLNVIAGLVTPDRGEIRLDGEILFGRDPTGKFINVATRLRRTAMVFQHFALFPHLTARENILFGVRRRASLPNQADQILSRMRLNGLADRYPHELSGGEQQRVAIARALAADSRVLLLDEPFSALDRPTRELLHQELRLLQEEKELVIIYVTHSLEDALVAGNRIGIINQGRVEQVSSVEELFRRPKSRAVLEILGLPNIIETIIVGDHHLEWYGRQLYIPELRQKVSDSEGKGVSIVCYISAEEVEVSLPGATKEEWAAANVPNLFRGSVEGVHTTGFSHRIKIRLSNGKLIEALVRNNGKYNRGDQVEVKIPGNRLVFVQN